jgi:hypothetical protein
MGFEGTRLAARMRFRRTSAAVAPAMPQFFDKREADTQACRHCALGYVGGLMRVDNAFTKVLRVWFHTLYYAANLPYRQLQTALGE